jgi:hypothetical protein
MDRAESVQIFSSVEEADEAAREVLRRMTPEQRVSIVTELIGADRERASERLSGTYKIIDVPRR